MKKAMAFFIIIAIDLEMPCVYSSFLNRSRGKIEFY